MRIKVLVTPVCQDDIGARVGNRPTLPKLPFTPGYCAIGIVDALGEGVTEVVVGDRVGALTVTNSYAEYLYWDATQLVQVPENVDPVKAVILILNYLVAYQVMYKLAKVKAGDTVLIIGASGGVGTAFLDLGRHAGLNMYGLASPRKHSILTHYGATPIDYHTQDYVEVLKQAEPDGIDFVFNGMDESQFERGLKVLRRGGKLLHYGAPLSMGHLMLLAAKYFLYNVLPNGKRIVGYGTHTGDVSDFREDWQAMFALLAERKIDPVIAGAFPLAEAAKANDMLESGKVIGNIVLLVDESLQE